ncbi:MAG: hypothetical protein ACXIVG_12195 [Pararhodobacter sp.]
MFRPVSRPAHAGQRMLAPVLTAMLIAGVPVLAPAPAQAHGGSVSLHLNPRSADEARALRAGLTLFAIHQDIRTNGHVTQRGVNNAASIAQRGRGSKAIVHQQGCNHDASIDQRGRNHAYGVFQFGCNTSAHVAQRGHGQTGVTIQYGW